jgi:hypothetical protein
VTTKNYIHEYAQFSTVLFFYRKQVPEHTVTQNSVGGGLVISMPGKKVPERHSGLGPSEKERPEQCSSMFHHKNTLDFTQVTFALKFVVC